MTQPNIISGPAPIDGQQHPETPAPAQLPVSLNLDALEREGAKPTPFRFIHDGKTYEMIDPQEIDWQDLLSGLRNPAMFLRFALSKDSQRDFFSTRVPAWKMNALMEGYQKHYGLPDLGNASALRT